MVTNIVNHYGKQVRFCSRDCYWKYRKNNKEEFKYIAVKRKEDSHEVRICEICGNEFIVYKNQRKDFVQKQCVEKNINRA